MHESEAEVLARIEATRAHMGQTMEQIGERVSPDRVQAELKARARDQVHEAKETMKYKARSAMRDMEHEMSEAGHGLWATIRENPIPAGMIGVGMAWLMANGRSDSRDYDREAAARYEPRARRAGMGYEGYAGPAGTYSTRGYETARGYETGSMEAGRMEAGFEMDEDLESGPDMGDRARERMDDAADTARERAEMARDRASEVADSAKHQASEAADTAKHRASEMADSAKHRVSEKADRVRHQVSDKADGVKHRASEMAERTSHRMDQAQHRAMEAGRHMGQRAQRAERRVEHAVQDNPLAAGAIAAALGLAAGLMIPETRREHEMFGPARDRMMESAERKARRTAGKARDAVRETASESARKAVDQVMPGAGEDESMTEPGR